MKPVQRLRNFSRVFLVSGPNLLKSPKRGTSGPNVDAIGPKRSKWDRIRLRSTEVGPQAGRLWADGGQVGAEVDQLGDFDQI